MLYLQLSYLVAIALTLILSYELFFNRYCAFAINFYLLKWGGPESGWRARRG